MINLKLQHPPPGDPLVTPWWPTGIWECYLCPGGEGNWTLLEWEGNFNLNCQVFFSWIHMIYLLIWRCWNVKSSLWWADGVEENLFKKVTVSDLNFYQKKNVWWNLALSSARYHCPSFKLIKIGAFERNFGLKGQNLNPPILKSSNTQGIVWGWRWGILHRIWIHDLPFGLLAQLVVHCTSIAEVMSQNPIQAWIFLGLIFTTA